MMKIGALALFGFMAVAPLAQAADTPAFVNATVCDAAAPLTAATTIVRRQVSTRTAVQGRTAHRPAARPQHQQHRAAAPAQARRHAARPAPQPTEEANAPSAESEAVLRPAVHFCITPAGWENPVRYT